MKSLRLMFLALFVAGCAAPLQVLVPAKEPLTMYRTLEVAAPANDIVGKIDNAIVNDIMQEAVEGILDLKHFSSLVVSSDIALRKELSDSVSRSGSPGDSSAAVAVLETTIVEYDEGSGFLRFLFGMMAGSGKVTLELSVVNRSTHQEVMKARTTAAISGAFATASNVEGPLARAIVNFVEDNFVKTNQ